MKKYDEVSFVNHFGQTINVGDQVVAVTTGYRHSVSVRKAVYLGRRGNNPIVMLVENKVVRDGNEWVRRTVTRRRTLPRGRIYPTSFNTTQP